MSNDILLYIQYPALNLEIQNLLKSDKITIGDCKLLSDSQCELYFPDLIRLLDILSSSEEIKKKIIEYRFNIIKIDKKNNIRLSPSKLKKLLYIDNQLKFTKDQKNGIKNICNFLLNPTKKFFGFFGFAGTGKTTTITTLVSQFLKYKMYNKIALVAPTNKAVDVIKNKFIPYLIEFIEQMQISTSTSLSFDLILEELKKKNINVDFITIHKLLNIKTDFDTNGKLVFVSNNKPDLTKYDLIIIDECSMISIPMIDQLLFEIRRFNIKVIFSGDPAQLPPINEKISSIFLNNKDDLNFHRYRDILNRDKDKNKEIYTQSFLSNLLNERHDLFINDLINMKKYTLTNVVRSKIDIVTKTCLLIRQWVENKIDFPPLEKYINMKGVIFYENIDEWIKKILKEFKECKNNNIIITWTNNKAIEYNNIIRQTIFNKKILNRFEIGDILIINDFYQIKSDKSDKSDIKPTILYTSEHIHLNSLSIIVKDIELFKNLDNELNFKKLKNEQLLKKRYDEFIYSIKKSYKLSYKCYELKINKIGDKKSVPVFVIHEDDILAYDRYMPLIQSCIKNFLITNSPDINREKQIIENIGKPLWKNFHETCIEPFAKLSYGYAITCHKAQGSNYYNVYVDANDIMKNNKDSEMRRCLYTSFTRTVNELNILF